MIGFTVYGTALVCLCLWNNALALSIMTQKVNSDVEQWSNSMRIKRTKVVLDNIDGIRGVLATKRIEKTDVIVEVPAECALQVTNDKQATPFAEFCPQEVWKAYKWDGRLAMCLLHVKHSQSKLAEQLSVWLEVLPRSFGTPLSWEDTSLQQLQYPPLIEQVLEQRREWRQLYDLWAATATQSYLSKVTYEEFTWAMGCVRSRAFSGPYEGSSLSARLSQVAFVGALVCLWPILHLGTLEQALNAGLAALLSIISQVILYPRLFPLKRYVLCPYMDMFNHKSEASSDVSFDFFSSSFLLTAGECDEGTQVFINYGKQSNDRLLQYYGFVEENNANDVYNFGCDFFELLERHGNVFDACITAKGQVDDVASLTNRMETLRSGIIGVLSQTDDKRQDSTPGSRSHRVTYSRAINNFDDITRRCVCALLISTAEWSELREGRSRPELVLDALQAALPKHDAVTNECLRGVAKAELESLSTSIDEDEKQLESYMHRSSKEIRSQEQSESTATAVRFRLEKKRLLRDCIDGRE